MVIRMRHTRGHSGNRRSHHALKAANLSACSHCGKPHRPHHMCLECGYYNGRQVMDLETLKAKRDARIKAKKERIKLDRGDTSPAPSETKEVVTEEKK
jgi:large subunit ribosomal protein L32